MEQICETEQGVKTVSEKQWNLTVRKGFYDWKDCFHFCIFFFLIEWDAILALKRWTNRNFNFRPSSCLEQWLLLVKLAHFPNISQKVLHPGAISRFLVQWSSLGLQQGCAEHPLCTTGSWAVPCSTSHLCQRAPANCTSLRINRV